MTVLSDVFAKEPPVIARQPSRPPQPPQQHQTPPPLPPLPPEMAPNSPNRSQDVPGMPRPPPKPPKPHQQQQPSPEHAVNGRPLPLPQGSANAGPPVPNRPSRYETAPPLPPQARGASPHNLVSSPLNHPQRIAQALPHPPIPNQNHPPYHQVPPDQRFWQAPAATQAAPPAWSQHAPQPRNQPPPPPPPDLLDEPLTLSIPEQTPVTAPPIPPNPEKDALLRQLASTLASMRHRSRQQNDSSMAGLQAQRTALLSVVPAMQSEMAQLSQLSGFAASNASILREALHKADAVIEGSRSHPKPDIDELLVAPTLVSNQLYTLVAEERALGDAIFMLGRAVERGRISPTVFAKTTRSLAREWYLKKALVRKIGQGMGLAS